MPCRTNRNQPERAVMPVVSMRELLEAGVHFGHQTRRWNPKMKRFIFSERGGIYIIDLTRTQELLGELEKLEANLGGVADMRRQPDAIFIVDLRKEQLAVREAKRLGLPIIALVDTNCDPDEADYVVPGNDDAIRSCGLIVRAIADAVEHGRTKVSAPALAATNGTTAQAAAATRPAPQPA